MKSHVFLIAALLASPAWSQDPAGDAPPQVARSFDVHGDAVKKIVHDTAASQYSNAQVSPDAPVDAGRREVVYVPPEDSLDPVPVRESPQQKPAAAAPAPESSSFLSSLFEFVIDQALDHDEDDGISSRNEMLRCRIQKEQKTSPPGIDNCPTVD